MAEQQKRVLAEATQNTAKRPRLEAPVSAVLFFWNLPAEISELEIEQFCASYGTTVCCLKMKEKNQAFVEMDSVLSAASLVEFFKNQGTKPLLRGQTADVGYSSRQHVVKNSKVNEASSLSMPALQAFQNTQSADAFLAQTAGSQSGQTADAQYAHSQYASYLQASGMSAVPTSALSAVPVLPGRILHFNITKVSQTITCDILYYILSQYGGPVLKVACFEKNGVQQAIAEFADPCTAFTVKTVLHGHSIFTDGCVLHIDFSTLTTVNVRRNDPNCRDYTTLTPQLVSPIAYPGSSLYPASVSYTNNSSLSLKDTPVTHTNSAPSAAEGAGKVVLVSNLNPEVSLEHLFKLFGTCGDVLRIKVMFNKRDAALIQYRTESQATNAIALLQGTVLMGSKMSVVQSRMATVMLPQNNADVDGLTQDYELSPLHRFSRRSGTRNEGNIAPPSESLHIANIPDNVDESRLLQLLSAYGLVNGFKFFANNRKMAVVRYDTVDSAINALVNLHGNGAALAVLGVLPSGTSEIDSKGLLLSFSKTARVD